MPNGILLYLANTPRSTPRTGNGCPFDEIVTGTLIAPLAWSCQAGEPIHYLAHNHVMPSALDPVVAALAELDDGELDALVVMVNDCPQFAPGFLAWVEQVCDWEHNRRQGLDYPLQLADEAIAPSETADSINAAMVMRASFADDDGTDAVTALLDAIVGVLTGGERRH
jgi:hypothetical protein